MMRHRDAPSARAASTNGRERTDDAIPRMIRAKPAQLMKLMIATIVEKEIQRRLVLPAMVEADPALTVKVLPALAGRIVEVEAYLGPHNATPDPAAHSRRGPTGGR